MTVLSRNGPGSVLLLAHAWTLPLNENSTHPFYGFYAGVFMTPLTRGKPVENDVKRNDFIEHRLNPETNTAETGRLAHPA